MPVHENSLSNLRPRIRFSGDRKNLKVYLPSEIKEWLKEKNASQRIELLTDLYVLVDFLIEKINLDYVGYQKNNFTRGLQDIEEIEKVLKEIK
ncbi:MAG: hypothetical protein ACRC2R_16975 [Xenococcaceae cyanobacterium]